MELWQTVVVAPVMDMVGYPAFFAEVVVAGLTAGIMYSLVALGFVLIFKASGVFNFAQGVLALFAALTLVGLMNGTVPVVLTKAGWLAMPPWLAIIVTIGVMIGLAFLIERIVLRPLVNQDPIVMFMSTIGLAFRARRGRGHPVGERGQDPRRRHPHRQLRVVGNSKSRCSISGPR